MLLGSDDVVSEELWAYELGWRVRVSEDVSLDTAVFVHDYDDLGTNELGTPVPDPNNPGEFQQDVVIANKSEALSWGVELASQWAASDSLTLHAGYSFLDIDVDFDADSTDPQASPPDRSYPSHIAHLRSFWDVSETVELDTALYWVDRLDTGVPSYLRADVRLGWHPDEEVEISLGVRGLFHDGETEFDQSFFGDLSETRTDVYLKLTWTPSVRGPELPRRGDLVMATL